MRRFVRYSTFAVAGILAAACSNTPTQPNAAQVAASGQAQLASKDGNGDGTGKPDLDPTWANGQTVFMIGPHLIVDARDTQPNLYEHAEELYLIVFPQTGPPPSPGAPPITLPSGYQPQCNPCFHPGLPAPFVYHDHVIPGAPGNNNTADGFKGPWKVMLMMYDPAYANSKNFTPITSEAAIDAAEAKGGVFLALAPGAPNPYEIETGNVLICPIIQHNK